MDDKELNNVFILRNIMIGDKVEPDKDKSKERMSVTRRSPGIGQKILSIFGNSREIRNERSTSPMFLKTHRVNPRLGFNNRRSHNDDPQCFHRSIGPVLLLAQFFGILPINSIGADTVRKFRFKRYGPRVIYSYCACAGIFFMTFVSVIHLFQTLDANSFQTKGGISDATAGAVFYGNGLFGNFLFLRLCPKWISLQHDWRSMERLLDNACRGKRPMLRCKLAIIATVVLSLALIEHVLSVINNTPGEIFDGQHSLEEFLDVYTNKSHAFILKHVDYSFTFGMFIFLISRIATFTWNFTDLFIMLVSTGLAERYKYLNARITEATPAQLNSINWNEIRQCYAALSALVKKVDDHISGIILLSFGNNIYFICLQLLNGLSPPTQTSIISSIYFFGSFIFLIGRTVSVTLLTARINDRCKEILPVLYNCPSTSFNIEAQRLQSQISSDDIALTGQRFFSITRNFMLAVAGAILTYEVVLLQFNLALQREEDLDES